MSVPSSFRVTVTTYSSVLKFSCRNGAEQMPNVGEPSFALTVKLRASGSAVPEAIATCARGMASVWTRVPVAGSQSQYPT